MKKEEVPVLVGLVLVGFFMLFLLASSVDDLSLTGHAVLGEYTSEETCVGAGYVWESLTEENCTDIPDCVVCEDNCVIDYIEVLCVEDCVENCTDIPDCVVCEDNCVIDYTEVLCTDGCVTDCENCEVIIIGGQCIGEICNDTCLSLEYECGTQTICSEELDCGTCDEAYSCESGNCELIVETCTEDWSCDAWTECSGGTQTRTCTDVNDCETEENKPAESQTCEIVDEQEEQEEEEETTETELVVEDTTPVVTGKTVEQIIAEMEAEQEVQTQEEVEDVETEEESEPLGEITGGIVGGEFNESECVGCIFNEKCYKFDKRKNDSYCTEEGWIVQKEINATCVEDFECLSNSCVEEQCGDYNWIRKFFNWIRDLFIKEIKINENQTIVNESEIIELE